MKAIETRYKGYRFRSRLEARWAVFFDALAMKWEYEPEGFVLPSGTHYLPDFRVMTPQGKTIWYEIKRSDVSQDDKFDEFNNVTKDRAYLLNGDPAEVIGRAVHYKNQCSEEIGVCPRCGFISDPASGSHWYGDEVYEFGCHPCDFETPSGGDNDAEVGLFPWLQVRPHKGWLIVEGIDKAESFFARVRMACDDARSVRFEHGENPRASA